MSLLQNDKHSYRFPIKKYRNGRNKEAIAKTQVNRIQSSSGRIVTNQNSQAVDIN